MGAPVRTAGRARDRRAEPLAGADLRELDYPGVGFEQSTPLWYYVLKEAEVFADGLHLGPAAAASSPRSSSA